MQIQLLISSLLITSITQAFDAGWTDSFLTSTDRTHYSITECALHRLTSTLLPKLHPHLSPPETNLTCADSLQYVKNTCKNLSLTFDTYRNAITKLCESNRIVDLYEVNTPEAHFDDESFSAGAKRLVRLRTTATDCALQDRYDISRTALGTLLHTLQDFYSHSDWIEIGYEAPNPNLAFSDSLGEMAPPEMQTCFSCSTLSECQSNINQQLVEKKLLTSGYFSMNPFSSKEKLRCSHGGTFDFTAIGKQGINKDNQAAVHGHLHLKAAKVAENSTLNVLQELWRTIGDARFRNFLGLGGSSFVISVDTTGSMMNEIRALTKIGSEFFAQLQKPFNFVLSPFNDPKVGPVVVSADLEQFEDAIRGLSARGGGDEPEMFYGGLLNAVVQCEPYSTVMVLTDASPKDRGLSQMIRAIVKKKNLRVVPIVTANFFKKGARNLLLEAIVREYHKLAAFAGGNLVLFNKRNLGSLSGVIAKQQSESEVLLVSRFEEASPDFGAILSFFVDDSVESIDFRLTSVAGLEFLVLNPQVLVQNFTNWEYNDPSSKAGSVDRPVKGLWRIWVRSNSSYSVVVTAVSQFRVRSSLNEANGNSMHPGFVKIDSAPVRGRNVTVFTEIDGDFSEWRFYVDLVRENLSLIGTYETDSRVGSSFLTHIRVPIEDFRVRIRALSGNGTVLERYERELVAVSSLRASFLGMNNESSLVMVERRRRSVGFRYTIENLGEKREDVHLEIRDSLGIIDFSKIVSLESGERLSDLAFVNFNNVKKWLHGVDIVTMTLRSIDSNETSQYAALNLYFL